jgi:hypothetical protein
MHVINKLIASVALTTTLAAGSAHAVTVVNYSFEVPSMGGSYQYDPSGAGWTFSGYSVIANYQSGFYFSTPPDGTQVGVLQSASNNGSSIDQVLSGLASGDSYTVSFYLADRANPNGTRYLANPVTVSFDGTNIGTYTPTSIDFQLFTATFTAASASGDLMFLAAANGGDLDTGLDLVTVSAAAPSATPLPAALPLFASGLGVMGWLARRRKRKAQAAA